MVNFDNNKKLKKGGVNWLHGKIKLMVPFNYYYYYGENEGGNNHLMAGALDAKAPLAGKS